MPSPAKIQQAIEALEQQRPLLGDAAIDAAIISLRQQVEEQKVIAERKLVTVMFADISGFTALAEKKDPEEVRSLMNKCFDHLVPVVVRYNGTIDKFIGDEIMALFGAPAANEKHAELACLCALEMMTELQEFNKENSLGLGLHIGLNTGLVIAGGIGSEGRQQYSVMGDAVNLGARLKDKARNGEIFAGSELYEITAPLFEFEKLEPVRVKGKEEAVQIYSLKGKIKQPASSRFSHTVPLVGREKELKIFRDSFNLLANKRGSVISVTGEAGIGKSRLLNDCKKEFNTTKGWYEGSGFSHLNQVSYKPVKEILMNMMPAETAEDNEGLRTGLANLLKPYEIRASNSLFPFLASLLGITLTENENSVIRYLDPVTLRQRLQESFVQFIKIKLKKEPVVLVWEDLHWADKETLQVIEKLCIACIAEPIINVLSFRPQTKELTWQLHEKLKATLDNYQMLELETLTPGENKLLIQTLAGYDTSGEDAALIFENSGGNPLYTEELFRVCREQGFFQKNKLNAIGSITLPNTLHGIIASRIDKLTSGEKWVIQTSSVIGRNIDPGILNSLIESEKQLINLDTIISGLLTADMIRRNDSVQGGNIEYFFKHAVTQEVAYNSLLISTRKEIHNRVAVTINNLYGPDHCFIAAWHFEMGDSRENAIEYYKKAAQYSASIFAQENELTSYSKAAELSKSLYSNTGPAQWKNEYCDLLEKIGEIYNKQTRREEALGIYDEALHLTDPSDRIRNARLNRKKALGFEVVLSSSKEIIEQFYQIAEESLKEETEKKQDWWTEWLELQLDKCWAFYWQNKLEMLQATLSAIEKPIDQYASLYQRVRYLTNKSILEFRLLSYQLNQHTIEVAEKSIQLSLQTNDLRMIITAKFHLGFAYLWANKIEESVQVFEGHREESEKIGDKVTSTRGLNYLFTAYRRLGATSKTEELVNEYLHSGKYPPVPEYVLQAYGNLVWVSWKKKDYTGVEENFGKCQEKLQQGATNSPFRFLYAIPLIAYFLEINAMEKIIPLLNDLVLPNQRKLEPDIQVIIDRVLSEYKTGKKTPDKDSIKTILDLAEQYKYI